MNVEHLGNDTDRGNRSTGKELLCQLRSVYRRFTSIVDRYTDMEVPFSQVLMPLQ
jgi:hypothetical protein